MKNLTLLFSFLYFVSCSPAPKTQANLKVSLGFAATAGTYPAGLFIIAFEHGNKKIFMKKVTKAESNFSFANGDWSFGAFAWDGTDATGSMSGNLKCAPPARRILNGTDISVDLNLAINGCAHPMYGEAKTKNAGVINPVKFISCAKLKENKIENDCSEQLGKHKSFRVALFDIGSLSAEDVIAESTNQNLWDVRRAKHNSFCVDVTADNISGTDLVFPIFDDEFGNLPIEITAFTTTGCTSSVAEETHVIRANERNSHNDNPTQQNTAGTNNDDRPDDVRLEPDSVNSRNDLYVFSDICTGDVLSNTSPFELTSTAGQKSLICSPVHLLAMNGSSSNYLIGKNIDLASDPGLQITTFRGTLDGQGYTLSNLFQGRDSINLNSGLINNMNYGEIKNLNLNDFKLIHENTSNMIRSGWLIANVDINGSGTSKVNIENINLTSSDSTEYYSKVNNGHVGSLIGQIDSSYQDSKFEISNITSNIPVIADTANNSNTIGGIVGYVIGNSSPDNNTLRNVQYAGEITASNAAGVGGIIGKGGEIQIQNAHYSGKITAENTVGGIIGNSEGNKILNSFSDLLFTFNDLGTCTAIGGAIGSSQSYTSDTILGSSTNLTIYQDSICDKVGGLVGVLGNEVELLASNNSIKSDLQLNGNFHGGVIGYSSSMNPSSIQNSIINTRLESFSAPGSKKGGLVGQLDDGGDFRFNIIKAQIQGDAYLAGAIGYQSATSSIISLDEIVIDQSITSSLATGPVYAGGIFGKALSSNLAVNNIRLEGNITVESGVSDTGKLAGYSSNIGYTKILHQDLNYEESGGNPITTLCYIAADCSGLDIAGGPWTDVNGEDKLTFESKWDKFQKYDEFDDSYYYPAGNSLDPFIINNADDWNQISNDEFLLTKTYKLENDIDFSGEASHFTPVGGLGMVANSFTGKILPNGHKLRNIKIDIDGYHSTMKNANTVGDVGIIRILGAETSSGAQVGAHSQAEGDPSFVPLIIESAEIDLGGAVGYNVGIVAGSSKNALILAHVKDSIIRNGAVTTMNIGGLIGSTSGTVVVLNSLFHGEIDSENAEYVAGLVGVQQNTSASQLEIINSKVSSHKIIGNNYVAGLIAQIAGDSLQESESRIKSNYVDIRYDYQNDTNGKIEAKSPGAGLASGFILEDKGTLIDNSFIEYNYVNLLNADVISLNKYGFIDSTASSFTQNYILTNLNEATLLGAGTGGFDITDQVERVQGINEIPLTFINGVETMFYENQDDPSDPDNRLLLYWEHNDFEYLFNY